MSETAAAGEDIYEEDTAAPSEEASAATAVADAPVGPLFDDDELSQFDDDDVAAGRAICKMLSLFFLYTVGAMALVGLWTYSTTFGD